MPSSRVLSMLPEYNREFDNYCQKLKSLSERAASYLLISSEVKIIYKENIRKTIEYFREEFYRKQETDELYFSLRDSRQNIFNGLIYLYQSEEADYQRGRRKDWSIYESTKQFEEQGWLFYGKEGLQIIGGVIQVAGGYVTFKTGSAIKLKGLQGIGLLAMATGVSNTYEHTSRITYNITRGEYGGYNKNFLKNITGDMAEYAGYNRDNGEVIYNTVDFSISMFLTFGALVKLKDPKRLLNIPYKPINNSSKAIYPNMIDRLLNHKGGFFLWHAMQADFTFKVNQMSRPYFIYNSAMAINKFRLLLSENESD